MVRKEERKAMLHNKRDIKAHTEMKQESSLECICCQNHSPSKSGPERQTINIIK